MNARQKAKQLKRENKELKSIVFQNARKQSFSKVVEECQVQKFISKKIFSVGELAYAEKCGRDANDYMKEQTLLQLLNKDRTLFVLKDCVKTEIEEVWNYEKLCTVKLCCVVLANESV